MNEIKDLARLLLGFVPWLLFLFLAGHSLASLELAAALCLAASLTFGFSELRGGFILQWGTFLFFLACVLLVNVFHVGWVAMNMDLIANISLAFIIWLTLIAGRPFALQYARRDLPPERWHNPELVRACRIITLVWAFLMTAAAGVSIYKRTGAPQATSGTYFAVSLCLVAGGIIFTTEYKRRLRKGRSSRLT